MSSSRKPRPGYGERIKKDQVGNFKIGDILVCKKGMNAWWGSQLTPGQEYTIFHCEEYEQNFEDEYEYDTHRKNNPLQLRGPDSEDFLKSERLLRFNRLEKQYNNKNKLIFDEQVITVNTDDGSSQTFVLLSEKEVSVKHHNDKPIIIFLTRNPVLEYFDRKQDLREQTLKEIL